VTHIPILERTDHWRRPYSIAVILRLCRKSRVKRVGHQHAVYNSNVGLKIPVYGVSQFEWIETAVQSKARGLSLCVDARVGPAGPVNNNLLMIQQSEYSSQFALNCSVARLDLPAVIIRAVVLNCYLEMLQLV